MSHCFPLLIVSVLVTSSCATAPKSAAQEDPHYLAAARLLACSPDRVQLSTTTRTPYILRGEGCGRTVEFAELCRNPGPHEVAYVQSVPPPPSVSDLERNQRASRDSYGNLRRQELDTYLLQSAQQRALQYGQGLADARMRDVGVPVSPEQVPRDQLLLPDAWAAANCRIEQR